MTLKQKRTRIYSRRGDLGETSLLFGPRVGKDHRRIVLLGVLDEFSVWLSWARGCGVDTEVERVLRRLQFRICEVGDEVATIMPVKFNVKVVSEDDIKAVEKIIDIWDLKLEPKRERVLPGGAKSSVAIQIARTICRRAERRACALLRFDPSFSPKVGSWLNRVGDLLTVLARFENMRLGVLEENVASLPREEDLF